MDTPFLLDLLDRIKADDSLFLKEKRKESAATFCCYCHRNTHAGYHPFWHQYRRLLCESCGKNYRIFLKNLGAVD